MKKPIPKSGMDFFYGYQEYYPSCLAKWVRSEIFRKTLQHTAPIG
jgi:hypothetical protein